MPKFLEGKRATTTPTTLANASYGVCTRANSLRSKHTVRDILNVYIYYNKSQDVTPASFLGSLLFVALNDTVRSEISTATALGLAS
jgi:hypothetical protein